MSVAPFHQVSYIIQLLGLESQEQDRNPAAMGSNIERFFNHYRDFTYNPNRASTSEFYRLCDSKGWDKGHRDRGHAHRKFQDALTKDFNEAFGEDDDDVDSWRSLAQVIRLEPLPENAKEAKAAFRTVFVNLVDVVDASAQPRSRRVKQFDSLQELQSYTLATGRFFPKDSAYAGKFLRCLLREIIGTYEGGHRAGGRGGKGKGRKRR